MRIRVSPATLARASSRHPWRTLVVWFAGHRRDGSREQRVACRHLDAGHRVHQQARVGQGAGHHRPEVLGRQAARQHRVLHRAVGLAHGRRSGQFQSHVQGVTSRIAALGSGILAGKPVSYYDAPQQSPDAASGLVSGDKRAALITVPLKKDKDRPSQRSDRSRIEAQPDGFTIQVAGQGTLQADFTKIAEEDLRKGESIGIAIALIVLIVVFAVDRRGRAARRHGVVRDRRRPRARSSLIGQLVEFNLFVTNMVTMIGLAVGIDYSLFIVSRYREERKKGFLKLEAIGARGRHRQPGRLLQRPDGGAGAARDVHHPHDDLPEPGDRRHPRDRRGARGVDDAAAGDPRRCSATGSTGRGCPSGPGVDSSHDPRGGCLGPHHPRRHGPPRRVPGGERR